MDFIYVDYSRFSFILYLLSSRDSDDDFVAIVEEFVFKKHFLGSKLMTFLQNYMVGKFSLRYWLSSLSFFNFRFLPQVNC